MKCCFWWCIGELHVRERDVESGWSRMRNPFIQWRMSERDESIHRNIVDLSLTLTRFWVCVCLWKLYGRKFFIKIFFMTTQQHQQNDGYVAWLRACSNWVVFQKWREIHHRIDWNMYSSHFICTHRFFAIIRWLAIEIIVEVLQFLFNLSKLFAH